MNQNIIIATNVSREYNIWISKSKTKKYFKWKTHDLENTHTLIIYIEKESQTWVHFSDV